MRYSALTSTLFATSRSLDRIVHRLSHVRNGRLLHGHAGPHSQISSEWISEEGREGYLGSQRARLLLDVYRGAAPHPSPRHHQGASRGELFVRSIDSSIGPLQPDMSLSRGANMYVSRSTVYRSRSSAALSPSRNMSLLVSLASKFSWPTSSATRPF